MHRSRPHTSTRRIVRLKVDDHASVFAKTGNRCYYCRRNLADRKWRPCVDHFVPQSRGGGDELSNLVPCCGECNNLKGNKTIEEARHLFALRFLDWPQFTRTQIEWLRDRDFDLSGYDSFRFWFEEMVTKPAHGKADCEENDARTGT